MSKTNQEMFGDSIKKNQQKKWTQPSQMWMYPINMVSQWD